MSAVHESILYEAATNSLASDASGDNCWTKMVTASFLHSDAESFSRELRSIESLIKKEYSLSSMPTSWRSAKSIVLTAMKKDMKLTDPNGSILGKSFVQAALKKAKEPSNPYSRVVGAISILNKCVPLCTPSERDVSKKFLTEVLGKC